MADSPESVMSLSTSSFNDAALCSKRYEYRHVERLIPRPRDVRPVMRRGTWIHRCLQMHDHGLPWLEELERMVEWAEANDVPNVGVLEDQTRDIVEDYIAFWSGRDSDDFGPYETVATELPVAWAVATGYMLTATIDRIVKDRKGRLWIWERKSTAEIPDSNWRNVDPQTMIQYMAARQGLLNMPVVGVIFDYVLTDPGPAVQVYKANKNGRGGHLYDKIIEAGKSVSGRMFEAAVPTILEQWQPDAQHATAEQYIRDMRTRLVNEAARFQRYPVLRPDEHAKETLRDVAMTAGELRRAAAKGHYKRSYNSLTCRRFCPYGELCMREYTLGRPSPALREELFTIETPELRSEGRSDDVRYSVPGMGAR